MNTDPFFFRWLLVLHVLAGGIALVVAPLALMAHKGGDWHRRWGRAFFWSMAAVCFTSVIMGVVHPQSFWLALVGIFSFHLVASGYRSLYLKRLYQGQRPTWVDHVLHLTAGFVNGGLIIWGVAHLALGERNLKSVLFLLFGTIGMLFVINGIRKFFQQQPDKRTWLYGHISGFLGGYIAAVSAFSAVNLDMIKPTWLQWTWPTILGTPMIIGVIRYYRMRFTQGKRVRDMADIRIE